MPLHGWLSLCACAGQLALALLALSRVNRSTLALPLALLGVDLFAWNFAAFAFDVSANPGWRWLDAATSPLTMPLTLHFVLAFAGRGRRHRVVLAAAYVFFALFGLGSALAFFVPAARGFVGSRAWAVLYLGAIAPAIVFGIGTLVAYQRQAIGETERSRARLVLAALFLGASMASTELWADLGLPVPRLANLGTLAAVALLAVVALRFRLLEREVRLAAAASALGLAALGVVGYLAVLEYLKAKQAVLVLGAATVTLAVIAVTRQVVAWSLARRERLERLALLGRFSAQMAHDLKNPLAALKGAVQFLKEEEIHGRTDKYAEFLDLMDDQIERVGRVVDEYLRAGRIEPRAAPAAINDVVRSVVGLSSLAPPAGVEVRIDLAEGLPACRLDRDLVARAVENLVRNAIEALPRGGRLLVRTVPIAHPPGVEVAVEDTGEGMDARTAERALDDFYTTKPGGSGLGLAFVRRVAEAHDGTVTLTSRPGRGTVVTIRLPVDGPRT